MTCLNTLNKLSYFVYIAKSIFDTPLLYYTPLFISFWKNFWTPPPRTNKTPLILSTWEYMTKSQNKNLNILRMKSAKRPLR